MRLREVINCPCGLRYMFDALEFASGASRSRMLEWEMMTDPDRIKTHYDKVVGFAGVASDRKRYRSLHYRLKPLKNISAILDGLQNGATMDDVAFFEIKELCLLSESVSGQLSELHLKVVVIPDLSDALHILDPEDHKTASFYIYDSYSEELKEIRRKINNAGDDRDELIVSSLVMEDGIRKELSQRLMPYAGALGEALDAMMEIDTLLAKARQMFNMKLVYPIAAADGTTVYEGIFNPEVRENVIRNGRAYQPVDIAFGERPTTIIGANMGGKTVVLKTVALCQYLFQFGFGVPAVSAVIDIKENVSLYIGEEEFSEGGLSSFGKEVVRINEAISCARDGRRNLVLIDEPARTTNPVEGTALVSALLEVMTDKPSDLIITTHYTLKENNSRKLRVKGLEDGEMDYRLVEVTSGEVPCEALAIAESLGADQEWIKTAASILEEEKNNRYD